MNASKFEMSYPCYLLLDHAGGPVTCNVEGDIAVLLFTDDDLLSRFRESLEIKESRRIVMENVDGMRSVLQGYDGLQGKSGRKISHVLIDPSSNIQLAACYQISKFVKT